MSGFHTVTPGATPLPPSNTCALARRERAVAEVRRGRFRRAGLQPGHKPTPANIFFSLSLGEMVVAHRDRVRGLCLLPLSNERASLILGRPAQTATSSVGGIFLHSGRGQRASVMEDRQTTGQQSWITFPKTKQLAGGCAP